MIERIPVEKRQGYMIPGYKEIVPKSWTIDKEKDIKLFKYWTNIDEPHEEYFALLGKKEIVKVVLINDFIDEDTVRWRLYQNWRGSEMLLQELREALKVYKWSGSPILSLDAGIKNVVIDF